MSGVSAFPERKEIIAGGSCLGAVALQRMCASGAEMRQRPDGFFPRRRDVRGFSGTCLQIPEPSFFQPF